MSYLANAISDMLEEHNLKSSDLAKRSDLQESQVSRWKGGQQINIRTETLVKLASGFSSRPTDHAKLLYAHLKDACKGPGAKFIKIELSPADPAPNPPPSIVLPPGIKEDIDIVASAAVNSQVIRALLHNTAQVSRFRGNLIEDLTSAKGQN